MISTKKLKKEIIGLTPEQRKQKVNKLRDKFTENKINIKISNNIWKAEIN